PRLQNDLREVLPEIFLDKTGDLFRVGVERVGPGKVIGGEAATQVQHFQRDVVFFLEPLEDDLYLADGSIPGTDVALLRPDVEGDAVGLQAEVAGKDQNVHCHVALAAELA